MSARDERIAPGDLVVVVKPVPCCGHSGSVGETFRVKELAHVRWHCVRCGKVHDASLVARRVGHPWVYLLARLKRIPPLDELERNEIVEELTA